MKIGSIKLLLISSLGIFVLVGSVHAQDSLKFHKNSISLNLGGSTAVLGATYERILGDHIIAEVGLGLISIGGGLTVYPGKIGPGKLRIYSGLKSTFFAFPLSGLVSLRIIYLPIGITYFSKPGINLGIDLGFGQWRSFMDSESGAAIDVNYRLYPNIKLGFRVK